MLTVAELREGLKPCRPDGLAHIQTQFHPVKVGSVDVAEGSFKLNPARGTEPGLTVGQLLMIVEDSLSWYGRRGDWVYIADRDGKIWEPVIVEAKNIGGVIW